MNKNINMRNNDVNNIEISIKYFYPEYIEDVHSIK